MSVRRDAPTETVPGTLEDTVRPGSLEETVRSGKETVAQRLEKYAGLSPSDSQHDLGHSVERDVQHQLLVDSEFHISSLVVHRVAEGICLQGTLWTIEEKDNLQEVSQSASSVSGVRQVLNHLVLQEPDH